jgi:hypothetical protein
MPIINMFAKLFLNNPIHDAGSVFAFFFFFFLGGLRVSFSPPLFCLCQYLNVHMNCDFLQHAIHLESFIRMTFNIFL